MTTTSVAALTATVASPSGMAAKSICGKAPVTERCPCGG